MTPSRWDKLLKRRPDGADRRRRRSGFKTFLDAGCQACHAGALLGGTSYQKIGPVKPFPRSADPGRDKVTKNEADKGVFKVPSLRNVEKTGPYFHDGQTAEPRPGGSRHGASTSSGKSADAERDEADHRRS